MNLGLHQNRNTVIGGVCLCIGRGFLKGKEDPLRKKMSNYAKSKMAQ